MKKFKCKAFLSVEPVILLYSYALFTHGPVVQQFVYHRVADSMGFQYNPSKKTGCGNETSHNETVKKLEEEVQSMASYVQLGITMFQSLPALVVSLLVGSWSDSRGRKPAIILPIIGSTVEVVITLLIIYLDLPVYVLFIGAACNGLFGYITVLIMGVMAYISDTTDESQRPLRLAIMEAMIFTGGMVSQLTSGYWIKALGFKGPYWFMLGVLIVSFHYAVFILRESRRPNDAQERPRIFSLHAIKRLWRVYSVQRENGRRNIFLLTLSDGLAQMSNMSTIAVISLYVLHSPLCFSALFVGYFLGFRFSVMGLGAAFGIKVLGFCINELHISRIGMLSMIASFILFGFSSTTWMVFLVPVAGLLVGSVGPIFKGMLSRIVSQDEQGALFSCVSSVETLFTFLCTFLFNSMYSYSMKINFPGLVFFIVAGIAVIPLLITFCFKNPSSLLSKKDRAQVMIKESGYQPIDGDDLQVPVSENENVDDNTTGTQGDTDISVSTEADLTKTPNVSINNPARRGKP